MANLNARYIAFVHKYKAYPNIDEFIAFSANRFLIHGNHPTLPAQMVQFTKEIIAMFVDAFSEGLPTPDDFCIRTEKSLRIENRVQMEQSQSA
jgi:hypothetical protein